MKVDVDPFQVSISAVEGQVPLNVRMIIARNQQHCDINLKDPVGPGEKLEVFWVG